MNLGDFYKNLLFLLGKDMQGSGVTPANFPKVLNDLVQAEYMNALIRKFEETREISSALRPFIKTLGDNQSPALPVVPWSANADFAYAQFPEDFWYYARAASVDYLNACGQINRKYRSVEWVDQARFDYMTGTDLLFPTREEPVATVQNDQILVCPALTSIRFTYIRRYANVVFDYDILANNNILYLPPGSVHTNSSVQPVGTPSASVELEWPESEHDELLRRTVQRYGRNIQNQFDMSIENVKP